VKINVSIHKGPGSVIEEVFVDLAAIPRKDEIVRLAGGAVSPTLRYLVVTEVHHLADASSSSASAVVFCKEV
jgi:hypothetical protein